MRYGRDMHTVDELTEQTKRLDIVRDGIRIGDLATIRASVRVLRDMNDQEEKEKRNVSRVRSTTTQRGA